MGKVEAIKGKESPNYDKTTNAHSASCRCALDRRNLAPFLAAKVLPAPNNNVSWLAAGSTLKSLHSDLRGRLYKAFDVHYLEGTIPFELEKWVTDYCIIGGRRLTMKTCIDSVVAICLGDE